MQLIELWIDNYKNLMDFSIDFSKGNGLTMLIGTNGSGKSNVIEALSAIFADLYNPAVHKKHCDFNYTVVYEIQPLATNEKISITKNNNKVLYERDNISVSWRTLHDNNLIPSNVISIYSGEETRLKENYYTREFFRYISNQRNYNSGQLRMIFFDKSYWNIALFMLWLNDSEDIQKFLKEEIGIQQVDSANFSLTPYLDLCGANAKAFVDKLFLEKTQNIYLNEVQAKERIVEHDTFYTSAREILEFFIQLSFPRTRKGIKDIEIDINNGLSAKCLSEGEKKLLLIQFVLEMIADENSLILLDEPDANIHESRKKNLYSLIKRYTNRQVVMTTHSPTFVDLALSDEVCSLKINENGYVAITDLKELALITHLTGNRMSIFNNMPVVYCESGENGLDKGLLTILFPNKKIVSTGSCEDVINKTKLHNSEFPDSAIGVIDADYHTEERKAALETNHIFMLPVLEIENVLMDFAIVEAIKELIHGSSEDLERFKQYFFKHIDKSKNSQSAKHTSNTFINEIKMSLQAENRDLQSFKDKVQSIIDVDKIDTLYTERLNKIEMDIADNNYEELIKRVDLNHKLDHFFNIHLMPYFSHRVLKFIAEREDLQDILRQKYYYFIE